MSQNDSYDAVDRRRRPQRPRRRLLPGARRAAHGRSSSGARSSAAAASPRSSRPASAPPPAPTCSACCASRSGATCSWPSAGSRSTRRGPRSTCSPTASALAARRGHRSRSGRGIRRYSRRRRARPAAIRGRPRQASPSSIAPADGHRRRPTRAHRRAGELAGLACCGSPARRARRRGSINDALFLFATSARSTSSERFESEHVKAALGWHAINDSLAGPSTPGTAYVLLHDHAAEQAGGGIRTWGFVRGGIGRVTAAMADAAREAGAEIRTEAPRSSGSLVEDGRGDRRRARRTAARSRRDRVLSNADPQAHLPRPRRRGRPACGAASPPRCATTAARARA